MASKKTTAKGDKKNDKLARKPLLIVIGIVGVAAILFMGWYWLVRNDSLYSLDKATVKAGAEESLSTANFEGKQVYSDLVDDGCTSNGVGLKLWTSCGFSGWKYYKNNGSLRQDLKAVDAQLINAGWQRTFNSQKATDLDALFSESNREPISYRSPAVSPRVAMFLEYYKDTQRESSAEIGDLVKSGKISAPGQNEYIYGVRINATYWHCSNESSLFAFCPAPPSRPNF